MCAFCRKVWHAESRCIKKQKNSRPIVNIAADAAESSFIDSSAVASVTLLDNIFSPASEDGVVLLDKRTTNGNAVTK